MAASHPVAATTPAGVGASQPSQPVAATTPAGVGASKLVAAHASQAFAPVAAPVTETEQVTEAFTEVPTETVTEVNTETQERRTRSFKVLLPNSSDYEGRFTGLTPYQAANKALSKYYRETNKPKKENKTKNRLEKKTEKRLQQE